MHPYMIRSFEPFFRPGSLLELGSFKGDFTRRFLPYFDDMTCVEASGEALAEARNARSATRCSSCMRCSRARACPGATTTSC